MWIAIGFGLACGLCAYAWNAAWMLPMIGISLVLTIGFILLGRKFRKIRPAAVLFLGFAIGLGWFWGFYSGYLSAARNLDGETRTVTVEAADYSYETDWGVAVDGLLQLDGKEYQTKVYLDGEAIISPGDHLEGTFLFRVTTGGQEELSYHYSKGIFLLAYQRGEIRIESDASDPTKYFAVETRHQILDRLDALFPEDVSGFTKALLLGERSDLDYETKTAFEISGISHIVAVSGLHVSILFALVLTVFGYRRVITAAVGIPLVILFMAVAGFTPSIVRAGIMQILVMLAMLLDREYDPPTALAVACLVILGVNPLTITSVGFQMSVACIIGIFLFYQKIYGWMVSKLHAQEGRDRKTKLKRSIASSVAVTLSATVMTIPLSAFYFGSVSLIGVVTNLLVLWAVSIIFYGVMAVLLLGALWMPLGAFFGSILAWLIRYVLLVARVLSKVPLAAVFTKSMYIVFWLAFCYILLAAFLASKNKRPILLAVCMAAGLVASVLGSYIGWRMDDCRVTVIDVGQGQSILLQTVGKSFLVDCGGDDDEVTADIVAETLLSQGVYRLDGVILTHFDRDHAGALPHLLTRIPAETVYLPLSPYAQEFTESVQEDCGKVTLVEGTMLLQLDDATITIAGSILSNSDNESGLGILFQAGNCDILITGDRSSAGEELMMRQIAIPKLELLIVGHHGSKYATSGELLEFARPDIAVISVGADNSYGHPSPEAVYRLMEAGCVIYRTDLHGTVIFRR